MAKMSVGVRVRRPDGGERGACEQPGGGGRPVVGRQVRG